MKFELITSIKNVTLVALLASSALTATYSHAGERGPLWHGHAGLGIAELGNYAEEDMQRKFQHMAKYLALSNEQKKQMKVQREQSKQAHTEYRTTMKSYHQQLKILMEATEFDQQAFNTLYTQYQPTVAQIALLRAKDQFAMRQILTDEQKQKWQNFKRKRKH